MAKKSVTGEDGKQYIMKEKKPFYKKVWFWILIVIVLIIIFANLGSSSEKGPKKVEQNTEKTTTKKSDSKDKKEETKKDTDNKKEESFKIGDTVDVEGLQLKINDVRYSESEGITAPKDGEEFVIINLTITNKSNKKKSFNPLDFSLNANGVTTSTALGFADGVDTLGGATLDPEATVTGNIVSSAVKESKLKLLYKPTFSLNKEVEITLR